MTTLILKKFDLTLVNDYEIFQQYKKIFLDIMKLSYNTPSNNYWGDDIYENKIKERNLKISILFYRENKIPIGCIILKKNGKLSGLAVQEEYRRKGMATYMINISIQQFPYIFVEVAIENSFVRKLLNKKRFKAISKKSILLNLLKNEEITILKYTQEYIIYCHGNRSDIHILKKFIMYEYNKTLEKNSLP